jgi:hypothetical protein
MSSDDEAEVSPIELSDADLSEVAGGTTVRDAHDRYSNVDGTRDCRTGRIV